jgi:IS5 family transposase
MRHRTAVEPVIGHIKAEHRKGRDSLKGRDGDRMNAVLAAAATTSVCSCAGSRGFCLP